MLNNIHLLLLPLLAFNLVKPWLKVFDIPLLFSGFNILLALVDLCAYTFVNPGFIPLHSFSSA
jgi:hypothetical protein